MANIYNMADTWDDAGTTFTSILMNVTDTNSASDSLLMDLQVGGASRAHVTKSGRISAGIGYVFGQPQFYDATVSSGAGFQINNPTSCSIYGDGVPVMAAESGSNGIRIDGARSLGFVNGFALAGPADVRLWRDAANTLAQRNGTNAQTFNLYNTYTDASNYERGFMRWDGNELEIGTVSAGTGGNRSVGIYSDNVRYQLIGSNFNQFDKNLYMNGANIVTGGAGFKIGTAANQPIGFWNATPVVQPTTGISAGSFVANTSGIINDTATFDGYTIGQVVAALRQIGLLA